MNQYPKWVEWKRRVAFKERYIWAPPSERRVADRKAIVDILKKSDLQTYEKIDEIINHFRVKYGIGQWQGLSKPKRIQLFKEKGGRCHWCKIPMRYSEVTIEHLIPQVEGGTDAWENLSIAHALCNSTRDGMLLTREGFLKETLLPAPQPVENSSLTNTPQGV